MLSMLILVHRLIMLWHEHNCAFKSLHCDRYNVITRSDDKGTVVIDYNDYVNTMVSILGAVGKFIQLKLDVTHKTKATENKISKPFA